MNYRTFLEWMVYLPHIQLSKKYYDIIWIFFFWKFGGYLSGCILARLCLMPAYKDNRNHLPQINHIIYRLLFSFILLWALVRMLSRICRALRLEKQNCRVNRIRKREIREMSELQKNIVERKSLVVFLVEFLFMYKIKLIKKQLHRYYLYTLSHLI